MTFKYSSISAGYLGKPDENATFNSAFYAELWSKPMPLYNIIQYPQRIPKVGFFDELSLLETTEFSNNFKAFVKKMKSDLNDSYRCFKNCKDSQRTILNHHHILLRYGQCQFLKNIDFKSFFNGDNFFEYRLLQENRDIEISLSFKKPLLLSGLKKLVYEVIADKKVSTLLKMKILNRLIVNCIRHKKDASLLEINHLELANLILSTLEKTKPNQFNDYIAISMIYRGIAMVNEFGGEIQDRLLKQSWEFANAPKPQCRMEEIIFNDNIYTLLQTVAKWHEYNHKLDLAETCLNGMIQIESNDSTGFSEWGLFLFKRERFEEAADAFSTAYKLGPPAVGMNMYFYAKCLEKLNNKYSYIKTLKEVTIVDHFALSPWLEILDYESEQGNITEVKRVAKHILTNNVIAEQLTQGETEKLKLIID